MAVPTLVSATISVNGTTFTMVWSEAIMEHSVITVTATYRGVSQTATLVSGDGTAIIVYSLSPAFYISETVTVSVPAGSIQSVTTADVNAVITNAPVTNGSGVTIPCGGRASRMFVNSCTIQRATRGQSATSAGLTTSWHGVYYSVCCAVQAASTSESETWMREVGDAVYRVYFPYTVDIAHTDRLTTWAGSSSLDSSDVLEVVSEPVDHSGHGNVYTMVLARPLEADA